MSDATGTRGASGEVPMLDRLVHDLKGPLAPLQTAAYLLGRDDLPPDRRQELLDTLQRQTRRLGQMIDEAGDWARASQHRLVSRRDPIDLGMLLDNAVSGVVGCHVEPQIDPRLAGVAFRGDEVRLQQMLSTLIRHACARHAGPVTLSGLPQLVASPDPAGLRITITDHGPALDDAALAGLLEQPTEQPADAGLGLRLLIARAIAQGHGGTLVAQPGPDGTGLALICKLSLG